MSDNIFCKARYYRLDKDVILALRIHNHIIFVNCVRRNWEGVCLVSSKFLRQSDALDCHRACSDMELR